MNIHPKNPFNYIFCFIFLVLSCAEKTEKSGSNFVLISKNSYTIDSYNGIGIYRLDKTRELMDGYYVVGDKFSKWEEFRVEKGILNGDYIVFHSNGEIFTHSVYQMGKLHGEEKTNYLSGKLKRVNFYNNNVLYGKSMEYFENGNVMGEFKIEYGKVVESIIYNNIGQINAQTFIKDGKTITQSILNGKILTERISSNYDNFEAIKFYNDSGSVKAYLRMLEEEDNFYLIEMDNIGNEMNRINLKTNPQEALKYQEYLKSF